ncbi:MAG: copper chaperone PCu(A)C [Candidatus Competibacteraceae bacterium]|uniref:Copper chaperone PCu(A)C n=2 Tax=Candidatus Contendibacter odensensis TaxID=1400860 RepID=A0A7U7G7Y1_9GAMM|nr:copper chaperone PCu(A)C [Candidatus Competibacteraceae bacterium]CDH43150.1 conserved exported hypothetical protein [Candidatus Contendobacter odensis Run_B_J11]
MKNIMNPKWFFSAFAALVLLGIPFLVSGHGYPLGSIAVRHPWAAPTQTTTGSGYLGLKNRGARDDKLVSASTAIAAKAELYTLTKTDAGLKIEPVDAIAIPAGEEIRLKPGGPYIQFSDLKQPLAEGDRFPVLLKFQNAGEIIVEMFVQKNEKSSIY